MSATLSFLDGKITIDPEICNGKPTLRGKRIAVQTILEYLAAGDSEADILEQYPSLTSDDIKANIASYAEPALPLAPGLIDSIEHFLIHNSPFPEK